MRQLEGPGEARHCQDHQGSDACFKRNHLSRKKFSLGQPSSASGGSPEVNRFLKWAWRGKLLKRKVLKENVLRYKCVLRFLYFLWEAFMILSFKEPSHSNIIWGPTVIIPQLNFTNSCIALQIGQLCRQAYSNVNQGSSMPSHMVSIWHCQLLKSGTWCNLEPP